MKYISRTVTDGWKPSKELKAFAKTKSLAPGESTVVTLKWNVMDMASFNEKASAWELAKGEYQFMLGANVADIKAKTEALTQEFHVMSTKLYEQAQAQAQAQGAGPNMGAGAGANPNANAGPNPDNVVDADFEVVDDK